MNRQLALLSLVLTGACAAAAPDDPEAASSAYAVQLPTGAAASVLELVNYPGTDADVLDRLVGLDSRTARGIAAARNGADGIAPSSDDVHFADLAAVDAVPYVGDAAFQKLQAYGQAHPAPSAESVEGVTSTSVPNAAAIVQAAVAAQLTDVVYIAVHAPDASIDRAVVNVYLVGRTACGDLVGLHSIAIET